MKKLLKKEMDELIAKAVKWTMSREGKREIKEAFERARKTSEKYTRDQRIDPRKLTEPYGSPIDLMSIGFFI